MLLWWIRELCKYCWNMNYSGVFLFHWTGLTSFTRVLLTQLMCNMQHLLMCLFFFPTLWFLCVVFFSLHFFLHSSYQAPLYEYSIWGSVCSNMRGCWHLRFTQQLQEAQEAPKGKQRAQRSPCDSQKSVPFRHHWENRNVRKQKKKNKQKWVFIIRILNSSKTISHECWIYSFISKLISLFISLWV